MWDARADRARERLTRLAVEGLDAVAFFRAADAVLSQVIPADLSPCWFTVDPGPLVITGHFNDALRYTPPEVMAGIYGEDGTDVIRRLAQRSRPVATLAESVDGSVEESTRYRILEPQGFSDCVDALLVTNGACWGALSLLRAPDSPSFTEYEFAFLHRLGPVLAEGVRRGLIVGELAETSTDDGPGMLVLDAGDRVEMATPAAEHWLKELPGLPTGGTHLPWVVLAVAARSRANDPSVAKTATARVIARSGQWLQLHGSHLAGELGRRVAVIIDPAHPANVLPLVLDAFGLRPREQEVVQLVLQGRSTHEIARAMFLSPYTVQDHLKLIFDRVGVRTRRELVSKVYATGYATTVEANDRRVADGLPLRRPSAHGSGAQ